MVKKAWGALVAVSCSSADQDPAFLQRGATSAAQPPNAKKRSSLRSFIFATAQNSLTPTDPIASPASAHLFSCNGHLPSVPPAVGPKSLRCGRNSLSGYIPREARNSGNVKTPDISLPERASQNYGSVLYYSLF